MRAATELIAKRGYHGATIELIIRRARVSYATFYKYFDDREACFLAILDFYRQATREVLKARMSEHEQWSEQVVAVIEGLFELVAAEPLAARACLVESLTAGPEAVARYEEMLQDLVPLLRAGRAEREQNSKLPQTLEDTLAGAVVWAIYQRLVVGEADKLRPQLPETLELIFSSYLGEDEAARIAAGAASR